MSKNIPQMRNAAKAFLSAANRCEQPIPLGNNQFQMLLVPTITSYAFSAELFLKHLLAKSSIEYQGTHALEKLFKLLPNDLKNNISSNFQPDDSFDDRLISISNSFVDWRYFYEKESLSSDLDFLRSFAHALSKQD